MKRKNKRIRRTAEEARAAILDAAERRLVESGPAGIRLQTVAADVGVSHPTVLHHFGSRDGLLRAVVERSFAALDADVIGALADTSPDEQGAEALLGRVAEALSRGGHARALAWLALSDYPSDSGGRLDVVVEALHQKRVKACGERGWRNPTREDTVFTVLLASFALLGEALVGKMLFNAVGRGDVARHGARFRAWFGRLLLGHLDHPPDDPITSSRAR